MGLREDYVVASHNRRLSDGCAPHQMTPRKRSGFSSIFSSVWGPAPASLRRVAIGLPLNPIHVTHVGYDSDTGEYTVGESVVWERNDLRRSHTDAADVGTSA